MNRLLAVLTTVCLAGAGCLASKESAEPPGPGDATIGLDALRLDDCHGMLTWRDQPSGMLDVERPPGWRPSDRPLSTVTLDFHECQRMMVGPFERGPVTLAFEMHNHHSTPENCTKGEYTTSNIIHKLWLSDPEIAQWLANQSLPAAAASFTWTANELAGGVSAPTIVIGVEGARPSQLSTSNRATNDTSESSTDRLFWAGPEGVNFIDFHSDHSYNAQYPGYFVGSFYEPFLYAQPAGSNMAGLGGAYDYGFMDGKVHHFRGFECDEELP